MKKRLGLFATLAMCATIGSVYATWSFAEGEIADTQPQATELAMVEAEIITKGELSVTVNEALKFVIDDTNNDHIGELVTSGSITVTYTPNDETHCNLYETVTMTCAISVLGEVFTVDSATITNEGVAEWTIEADDLGVALKNTVELHTKDAYDEFNESLSANSISLVISAV